MVPSLVKSEEDQEPLEVSMSMESFEEVKAGENHYQEEMAQALAEGTVGGIAVLLPVF